MKRNNEDMDISVADSEGLKVTKYVVVLYSEPGKGNRSESGRARMMWCSNDDRHEHMNPRQCRPVPTTTSADWTSSG